MVDAVRKGIGCPTAAKTHFDKRGLKRKKTGGWLGGETTEERKRRNRTSNTVEKGRPHSKGTTCYQKEGDVELNWFGRLVKKYRPSQEIFAKREKENDGQREKRAGCAASKKRKTSRTLGEKKNKR